MRSGGEGITHSKEIGFWQWLFKATSPGSWNPCPVQHVPGYIQSGYSFLKRFMVAFFIFYRLEAKRNCTQVARQYKNYFVSTSISQDSHWLKEEREERRKLNHSSEVCAVTLGYFADEQWHSWPLQPPLPPRLAFWEQWRPCATSQNASGVRPSVWHINTIGCWWCTKPSTWGIYPPYPPQVCHCRWSRIF